MVKVIKYKFLSCVVNTGTEENPKPEEVLLEKSVHWSAESEDVAKKEAYNGEYTIEDDGQPEAQPTDADRIAELEEALNLLLSGVTE